MAETTNPQITDAMTQANVKVLADAPAMAMGNLYQAVAHSTGILFQNAVTAQQQQNTLAQAAATQGIIQLYSVDASENHLFRGVMDVAPTPGAEAPAKGKA